MKPVMLDLGNPLLAKITQEGKMFSVEGKLRKSPETAVLRRVPRQ